MMLLARYARSAAKKFIHVASLAQADKAQRGLRVCIEFDATSARFCFPVRPGLNVVFYMRRIKY